jgi:predicted molibdopterin-dependent oxidoreductase YjgC
MRILDHPILEPANGYKNVVFTLDGKSMHGLEGEPIAMALKANGIMVHRYSARFHEPRGIFCAIGRCTDCVMIVDGRMNVRTCITPLREGMCVQTQSGIRENRGEAR